MLFYFATTLFVSALLLFLVQPMVAKMTLPLLGGSPAVWNTCMVFFQAMLLLGYLYAHLASRWQGVRRHALVHLGVLLVPFLFLPIGIRAWGPPSGDANPIPWLLLMLTATVGVPFFVVSTTAPLLQTWFANTGHPAARDPYFLYGASNLGSMIALLGYPFLMEPTLRLVEQSWVWFAGYALLVLMMAGCAFLLWRSGIRSSGNGADAASAGAAVTAPAEPARDTADTAASPSSSQDELRRAPVTLGRRLRWIALSFVPSSLLLGFTTFLTTDIAAVPLLWVVPLALYLLTFIVVFARKPLLPHWLMVRLFGIFVIPYLVLMLGRAHEPTWLVLPVQLVGFFLAALVCHGELARDRPDPAHLTEFYLLMSVGGVLGGLFNALIAPLVFSTVLEYPLVVVLACFIMPRGGGQQDEPGWKWEDLFVPIGLLGLGFAVLFLLPKVLPEFASHFGQGDRRLLGLLGALAVLSFPSVGRPVRFGLCLLAVVVVGVSSFAWFENAKHQERSFFGVHRVLVTGKGRFHELVHGNISHGKQSLDPAWSDQPLAYYHRTGPLGDIFAAFKEERRPLPPLGVIGLGSGGISTYLESGQSMTYYEIDPSVERIARDPKLFTYLRDAKGQVNVVLGDGRLTLASAPAGKYGMLIVDAFSSDAIPMHLLTREAIVLYLSRLRDDGILVFHISNRYLTLEPVLGDLAGDLDLTCLAFAEYEVTQEEIELGKMATHYVVMARKPKHLGRLAFDEESRFYVVEPRPGRAVWTDDFSNILSVLW